MARRENAAPVAGAPELDQRRPAVGHPGADDGAGRPGLWRPLASAGASTPPSGSAGIRWMGRQADRPLQLPVGGCCCPAGDEVGWNTATGFNDKARELDERSTSWVKSCLVFRCHWMGLSLTEMMTSQRSSPGWDARWSISMRS